MKAAVRSRIRPLLAAILLSLALGAPAAGQKLPSGEEHRHRERTYDLQHLRADLRLDLAEHRVDGRVEVRLEPLGRLETVVLDAVALEVRSVTLDGRELEFETAEGHLEIRLPAAAAAGKPLTLAIDYRARPRAGMYFQPDRRNPERTFVHTYGEGGLHANWLPLYADVNDKHTSEMVVTVPKPYVVVSNGRLVETVEEGETVTYHWSQERPHPSYLISIYVGDFERGELEPAFGEIPVAYWVPRGRLEEGAYAFRNTTRMVEFFSQRFDYRYPWVKYDQIAVPTAAGRLSLQVGLLASGFAGSRAPQLCAFAPPNQGAGRLRPHLDTASESQDSPVVNHRARRRAARSIPRRPAESHRPLPSPAA